MNLNNLINKQFILKDSSHFWVLDNKIDKSYWQNNELIERFIYHIITEEDYEYWPMTFKMVNHTSINRQGIITFTHPNGELSSCDRVTSFNTIKIFKKSRLDLIYNG